jgi:hypothetical protein
MSSAHASTVNASIAAHEASHSQSQVPATPSQGDASSGVDLSTAAAFGSFAESPVQQQLTSAIMDAVNHVCFFICSLLDSAGSVGGGRPPHGTATFEGGVLGGGFLS